MCAAPAGSDEIGPGTAGAALPGRVASPVVTRRAKTLAVAEAEMRAAYAGRHAGREATILIEKSNPGDGCAGLTETYVRVRATCDEAFEPGTLARVRVNAWTGEHLTGSVVRVAEPALDRTP